MTRKFKTGSEEPAIIFVTNDARNTLLVLLLEHVGTFDFDVVVHRVACGLHEVCEEQATFLGLAVVAEYAVALVREAFRTLLEQVDPAMREIHKTRYCLTYENQYFEIDVFPCWNDQAMAEIELSHKDVPVVFPPELKVKREVTGNPAYRNAVIASKPRGATH